jgi:hypothetical protein
MLVFLLLLLLVCQWSNKQKVCTDVARLPRQVIIGMFLTVLTLASL